MLAGYRVTIERARGLDDDRRAIAAALLAEAEADPAREPGGSPAGGSGAADAYSRAA